MLNQLYNQDQVRELSVGIRRDREDIFNHMAELRNMIMPHLEPYIRAMLTASGITEFQAKTMIYYGLGCYQVDSFDEYPLLTLLGDTGTGKSRAVEQLEKVLPEWKLIEEGATYSDLAKGLDNKRIVVIEEADKLQPLQRCEGLLQDRTQKARRKTVVHIPPTMIVMEIDNWGATIVHKRESFNDIATRNRSIIIKTEKKVGYWQVMDVDTAGFADIGNHIIPDSSYVFEEILLEERVSSRTLDMWRPVIKVAEACGDVSYLVNCIEMLNREMLKVTADDEPLMVTAQALISAYYGEAVNHEVDYTKNIKLSKVAEACKNNLLVNMSSQKIKGNLRELGYEIKFYAGNNWIVADAQKNEELEHRL